MYILILTLPNRLFKLILDNSKFILTFVSKSNYIMLGMFRKKKEIKIINKTDSFIFDTFLKLTSKTYPYGFEDDLVTEMTQCGLFPKDLQKDKHGNYFYKIGK